MAHSAKRHRAWARVVVDVAMAVLFIVVMATALVQEVPHEYVGVALFVAVVAHIVLNRRWFRALFRGRYNAVRVLQLVAVVGLLACIAGQVVSSLVLSKYALGFLPALPGASWARRVHMLCSYWMFVFSFAHVGLHVRTPRDLSSWQIWALRIIFAAIACFGVYSFLQLNLWAYLTGQVQFAFVDPSVPIALSMARYASIAVLVAGVFHYVKAGIMLAVRRGHQQR